MSSEVDTVVPVILTVGWMQTPVHGVVSCIDRFHRLRPPNSVSYQCHLIFNSFLPTPLYDCLPVEAGKNVTDFGAALTEAEVTNNTLELADGTFFLGEAKLGFKLFIRPCYKELSELVLDGASSGTFSDIVVTGTPGIGKSMFGLYLLYMLRCQGKTVVFCI